MGSPISLAICLAGETSWAQKAGEISATRPGESVSAARPRGPGPSPLARGNARAIFIPVHTVVSDRSDILRLFV